MLGLLLCARRREPLRPAHGNRSHQPGAALPHCGPRDDRDDALPCTLAQLALLRVADQTARGDCRTSWLPGRAPTAEDVATAGVDRPVSARMHEALSGCVRHEPSTGTIETLAGCHIRLDPGSRCRCGIHHSAAVWPEPEVFDPRRFDVPARQFPGSHRYAMDALRRRARACIAGTDRMLEIPIVIAAVLQSFVLETPLTSGSRARSDNPAADWISTTPAPAHLDRAVTPGQYRPPDKPAWRRRTPQQY